MNNLFLLILSILFIMIFSQVKPDPQTNNQKIQNNQKNESSNPSLQQQIKNIINQTNQANSTKAKNETNKPEKEFNLTESLINFYNEMFGPNKTNNSGDQVKISIEKQKFEQRRIEDEKRQKKMEQIRMEAERVQREKEKQRKMQLEKEREEFESKIANISVSEFTNLYLEKKSGELLYHNLTKPCNLQIIFLLTDTQKTIHLTFNGPNGRGGTTLIKSFRSKNFLYYEYYAQYPGQYTFYLNNYHNSDETEVIFALSDNSKTDDKLGKKNIDKISKYLNDMDYNINRMTAKQNIINKKTDTHNESINKHNREILFYSIVEVVTMLLVFVLQTFYIKNIVEKL